jgi:hypothetical protein
MYGQTTPESGDSTMGQDSRVRARRAEPFPWRERVTASECWTPARGRDRARELLVA